MRRQLQAIAILLSMSLAFGAWPTLAAEGDNPSGDAAKTSDDATEQDQADDPNDEPPADPYEVPDGSADELVEYLKGLLAKPPTADNREKAMAAIQEACERIMEKDPTDEQLQMAVQLQTMLFGRDKEKLEALAKKLREMDKPELLRRVETALIASELRELRSLPPEQAKQKLQTILDDLMKQLAEDPDPQLISLATSAARLPEMLGDQEMALRVHKKLADLLADSDNPAIQQQAERLRGVVRRMELPGKKMELTGTTLEGEPFDISSLEGNIVLVDFWASWCGPCRASLPHLKELYDAYNDRGFEIVGVNLDRSREDIDKFLEDTPLPWVNLFKEEGQPEAAGYYGVMGIPTYFLVGADGKVISTNARGSLDQLLEERLGPMNPEGEGDDADGDEEPTDAATE